MPSKSLSALFTPGEAGFRLNREADNPEQDNEKDMAPEDRAGASGEPATLAKEGPAPGPSAALQTDASPLLANGDHPPAATAAPKKKKKKSKKAGAGTAASPSSPGDGVEAEADEVNTIVAGSSADLGDAASASNAASFSSADMIDAVDELVGKVTRGSLAAGASSSTSLLSSENETSVSLADADPSSAQYQDSDARPPQPSSPSLDDAPDHTLVDMDGSADEQDARASSAADQARSSSPGHSQGFVTPDSDLPPDAPSLSPVATYQDAAESKPRDDGGADSDDEDAPGQAGEGAEAGAPGGAAAAAKRKKKKKKKPTSAAGAAAGDGQATPSDSAAASSSSAAPDAASASASSSSSSKPKSSTASSSSSTTNKNSAAQEKMRSRREQLQQRRSPRTFPIIPTQRPKSAASTALASTSEAKPADPKLSRDQAEAVMNFTSHVFFHNYLRQMVGGTGGITVVPRGSQDDDEREPISRRRREEERHKGVLENLRRLNGGEWELGAPLYKMKYDFVQTPNEVLIKVFLPNVKEEEVEIKWSEDKKLEIHFPTVQFYPDEPPFIALNLWAAAKPSKTKIDCKPTWVTITLTKARPGQWEKLERSERDSKKGEGEGGAGEKENNKADKLEMRADDIDELVSKIQGKPGPGTAVVSKRPMSQKQLPSLGTSKRDVSPTKQAVVGEAASAEPAAALASAISEQPAQMPGSWVELDGTLDGENNAFTDGSSSTTLVPVAKPVKEKVPAGLYNMGQTCYLNSILQALVSIPGVAQYFVDDKYTSDINPTNPLGHKGEMAKAFAAVVKQLLKPGGDSFTPKSFLHTLRRVWYALQDEYQQHDAQELMAFLLDAVHEDLNRVQDRKKVGQLEEKEDEPDAIAAKRFWDHHWMLNDSEIVKLFQGLYKNTVECKSCGKRSVRFDPFMYMGVSLPEERIQVRVLSTSLSGERTVHPPQAFNKEARFDDVRKRMGFNLGVVVAVTEDGTRIKNVHKLDNRISSIAYSDILGPVEMYLFELEAERAYLAVHHEMAGTLPGTVDRFGTPLVLSVPAGAYTRAELYRVVVDKLKSVKVIPDNFDPASKPPPFLVRTQRPRTPSSPTDSDDESSEGKKRSQEEAEQLGLVEAEGVYVELAPTKFERVVLDWRAEGKEDCYLDKGFKLDSDSDSADEGVSLSPTKGIKANGISSPTKANGVGRGSSTSSLPSISSLKNAPITLEDCIHMFGAAEDLDEDAVCEKCKSKGTKNKRLTLYTTPDVLIIHIKRFQWLDNPNGFSYNKKIDVHVDFPTELELGKIAEGEGGRAGYRLFAVVNHYGSTFSGHYTTYCDRSWIQDELSPTKDDTVAASSDAPPPKEKEPAAAQWYEFDDEAVKKIDESEVKTKWAYLLFYRRVDGKTRDAVSLA